MPGAYAATFAQPHSVFTFRFQPVNGGVLRRDLLRLRVWADLCFGGGRFFSYPPYSTRKGVIPLGYLKSLFWLP